MTKSASKERDRVIALAKGEPHKAMELARRIQDPWFASQALAWVGRFWPDKGYEGILAGSLDAGRRSGEPYRIASSAAWPIRAFLERGAVAQAEAAFAEAFQVSRRISYPGSLAEAVLLLFQASKYPGTTAWMSALDYLANPENPRVHWRQERNLRYAVAMLTPGDLDEMRMARVSEKILELAQASIENGDEARIVPRPFFST